MGFLHYFVKETPSHEIFGMDKMLWADTWELREAFPYVGRSPRDFEPPVTLHGKHRLRDIASTPREFYELFRNDWSSDDWTKNLERLFRWAKDERLIFIGEDELDSLRFPACEDASPPFRETGSLFED